MIKRQKTNQELRKEKARIKKLESIIKARLELCQKQNGLPYCKNCGLSEEDIK